MLDDRRMADLAQGLSGDRGNTPVPLTYDRFGSTFLRLVLHKERVLRSIDRLLGETLELAPIGAGPGRVLAKVSATGTYGATYGEELEGDLVGYRIYLPVSVDFDLDLKVDSMRFHAEVLLPLTLTMLVQEPLTIIWKVDPPTEDEVTISVVSDTRRSAVLQKLSGLDGELRRFLIRFVTRELEKPYIRKATRIDLVTLIDGAWPVIAAQFLPNGPEDRS
jgi:hypothetical protein